MKSPIRFTRVTAALAIGGLIAAGTALANPRGPMLEKLDTDNDGVISQAEHEAHLAEKTAGLDVNGDGSVSFEEMQAHSERQREQRARSRFERLDRDGDGSVSVAEFNAMHEHMFERMDKDEDGQVSAEEMKRGHRMHRRGGHHGKDRGEHDAD